MRIPFFIGLIAALVHVLTGPDHLAAVTPLVLEKKSKYWKIGLGWGLGHVIGMLLIGLLFYFFKERIPVEYISKYSEKFVGFMLIGIGIWAFYRAKKNNSKLVYPHVHQTEKETFIHIHKNEENHHHQKKEEHNVFMSFFIGIIHGFAGISHFILMLPVLGYTSKIDSVLYMTGFAVGIVTAMVLYVSLLYKFSKNLTEKSTKKLVYLQYTGALFACIIGGYWILIN